MTRYVVDASAWVELVCGRNHWRRLAEVLLSAQLHVPALCDVEVIAALRKLVLSGRISSEVADEALDTYLAFPVRRHGHELLARRMLQLRSNFTAYDSAYLALAEALDARLVTLDAPLARSASAVLGIATA